jgi:prenyltransferase beta subunit
MTSRCVLLLSLLACSAVAVDPFIRYIHELQSPSGGFHDVGVEEADLKTTSDALFLTALYGLRAQVNADDAATFIQNHESATDKGYAAAAGTPSDIESTRAALMSYLHLGKDIPNAAEVGDFVRSLFNVNTGLFASRAGEAGDLQSTALAIESLYILKELEKPILKETLKSIKGLLSESATGTDTRYYSFEEDSATPVTDNYHGLLLAKHSGVEFKDADKWIAFVSGLQDVDPNSPTYGGFFSNLKRNSVTPEATAHATLSLHLLGAPIGNEDALNRYVSSRKASLSDTVACHMALAHTSLFKKSFNTRVVYDTKGEMQGDQIMEGMKLRPALVVTTYEGQVPHGGFVAEGSASGGWDADLEYDTTAYGYISDNEFDTAGKLGSVDFTFNLKATIYPVGDIEFTVKDTKLIGYHLDVESEATFAGRVVEADESVVPGTEFQFGVSLATMSDPSFVSGDFYLDLSVVDSSGVVHSKETIDGRVNDKPIELTYSLTGEDFPSGEITFLFEVLNDAVGVHTRYEEKYNMEQQMVASHVSIDGGKKLGSSLKVTMQPGSLKDLHTPAPLSADNDGKRTFYMDLVSAAGTTLLSVKGTPSSSGSAAEYSFETEIPATLDFVGTSIVSFRFASTTTDVKLQLFDAEKRELVDDQTSLKTAVSADIHLSDVTKEPSSSKTTELTFGSSLEFSFKLRDEVSKKSVVSGSHSAVSVSLTSDGFESASAKAVADSKGRFDLTLDVDANAARGKGDVTITAAGVDESIVTILRTDSEKAARYPVNVGGEITVDSESFSTSSSEATTTSFILTFSLACDKQALKNARLTGAITTKNSTGASVVHHFGQPLNDVPVAQDGEGKYSLSFSLPHDEFSSGKSASCFLLLL